MRENTNMPQDGRKFVPMDPKTIPSESAAPTGDDLNAAPGPASSDNAISEEPQPYSLVRPKKNDSPYVDLTPAMHRAGIAIIAVLLLSFIHTCYSEAEYKRSERETQKKHPPESEQRAADETRQEYYKFESLIFESGGR
ncbi:MAG: hypothetical protein LBT92_01085 [Rickettsiales bacterium]|nr:hypothetical protein [Rickettsiales bacterium]